MKERIVGLEELVHKLKEIIKEKLPEIYKSIVQSKQKNEKKRFGTIEKRLMVLERIPQSLDMLILLV